MIFGSPPGDPLLHGEKRVPAPDLHPAQPASRRMNLRIPIHGDRMVDGGHRRIAACGDAEQTVGETLVVMNDIVSVPAPEQMTAGAEPEGEGFRKSPRTHAEEFELIERRGKIADLLDLEEMVRIVKIQTGDLVEGDAFIQLRIGGTRQDIDLVAELPERPAQVFDVNPLPPAGRIPAVGQKTDPQGGFPRVSPTVLESRNAQSESPRA